MTTAQLTTLCSFYEIELFAPAAWDMFYLSNKGTSEALAYWGVA